MSFVIEYSKQRYRNIKTLLSKEAKFNQPNVLHLLYTQTLRQVNFLQQVRFNLKDVIHVFFLLIFNDKILSLFNWGKMNKIVTVKFQI